MMTPDEEREADAFTVWKQHGDRAPAFVASRIGELALTGDVAGVERWKQIAAKLVRLMRAPRQ